MFEKLAPYVTARPESRKLEKRKPEFERELRIPAFVKNAGLNKQLWISELQGLFVSGTDGGETVVGMLMALSVYPEAEEMGRYLLSPVLHDMVERHEKWERQVTETVEEDWQGIRQLFLEWLPKQSDL